MNEPLIDILKKIKIRYVALGVIVAILLFIAPRYAIIVVSVETPDNLPQIIDPNTVDHTHDSNFDETIDVDTLKIDPPIEVSLNYSDGEKTIGTAGVHFVKRGASGISAQAGEAGSRAVFLIPWYGFALKSFDLKLDTNAEKIAYRHSSDQACGVYSERLGRMAQYTCGDNPTALTTYEVANSQWKVRPLADLYYPHSAPVHYKGGLLGLTRTGGEITAKAAADSLIREVTDAGETHFFKQPEGINCVRAVCIEGDQDNVQNFLDAHETPARIFTDTTDQTNKRFVFVSSNGAIYLGTPGEGSDVSYKKFDASEAFDPSFYQTLCSINGTFVACIQGQSNTPANYEVSTKKRPSELLIFDFESNEKTIIPIRDNAIFVDIITTTERGIFAKEGSTLLHLEPNQQNTKVKETEIATNVDKIAANDTVFYTHNRAVYQVDPSSFDTHRKFISSNILPRQLVTAGKNVFVLGSAPQNLERPTYAWKLNDEPNLTPNVRIIDRIPTRSNSIAYGTNNLIGNKLYLEVSLGDRPMTQTNVRREIDRVKENLQRSGVNIDGLEFVVPELR